MSKDAFGFRFWLSWILLFVLSFLFAALFWTGLMTRVFKDIRASELVMTWALGVFGSWFVLLTPFMRKKERIWKRLNTDQERATDAWLGGLSIFLGSLMLSALFWCFWFKTEILQEGRLPGIHGSWLKNVFTTWLLLACPFLIYLYKSADRIFREAVIRQGQDRVRFKSIFVEKTSRILPEKVALKIQSLPETLQGGHVVDLTLKNGTKISNAFIFQSREILGLYQREAFDFEPTEVADAEAVSVFPAYEESAWLRLDGRI